MAIRQEELLVREAVIYRFPTEAIERRRARAEVVGRRRAAVGVMAVVVAAGVLAAWTPSGEVEASARQPGHVVVGPGETWWDIAEVYAAESVDPRSYVDRLQEINDLSGPIRPGMRLKLPR